MGPEGPVRAHVFVADLESPVLDTADRHHLERVLRLRAGDVVTASDGQGHHRAFRLQPGRALRLEPVTAVESATAPAPAITVAFALTKGERPEWVVQKLTELGIDRITPFVAARSVVRWDASRSGRHLERLRRVSREAAMQSRRTFLPVVDDLTTFEVLAADPASALADRGGAPPSLAHTTVLVGPEGGWSDEERARAPARVDLGPHVLRAETAAVAAATLLAGLRDGVVQPVQHDPESKSG